MRALVIVLILLLTALLPLLHAVDDYKPGPDSLPQPGVPKGELIKDTFSGSTIFPGTTREVTIYLPAGLDRSKPSPFMVFQDGVIYQAPAVLDNLIARKEIPPLVGLFIKPGVVPAPAEQALPRFNRSHEYDSVTDDYARFLIGELLPALQQKHGLNLSADPDARAIAGSSSGGICAFMVAWHRPDAFRRVFTSVGTYVGIHGADQLPVLVRKVEPKPLRLFLQSGEGDNNLYCGDWWMANQMMERSLTWAGYEVNHAWGDGGHNQKQATAIFPEVLRWLWQGYPEETVKANPRGSSKWRGYEVFEPGSQWTEVPVPGQFQGSPRLAVNAEGELFFSGRRIEADGAASPREGLWKAGADGKVVSYGGGWGRVGALAVDHQGNLRVAAWMDTPGREAELRIVALDAEGRETGSPMMVAVPGAHARPGPRDLCFSRTGWCYFSDEADALLFAISPEGKTHATPVPGDLGRPGAIVLSPDQSQIYVASQGSDAMVAGYQIGDPATFAHGQRYYHLERDIRRPYDRVDAAGLAVDVEGRLYAATRLGLQVCDQAGRVNFIIPTPIDATDVAFGGKDLSVLYIVNEGKLYQRPARVRGAIGGPQPPLKPAPPKL